MRRFFTIGCAVLAGILLLDSEAYGAEDGPQHTLFYLFSVDDERHLGRALQLEEAIWRLSERVQVVGVVRLAADGDARSLVALRQQHGFTYELVDATDSSVLQRLPIVLHQRLQKTASDYAVLVDVAGTVALADTGEQLTSVLAGLTLQRVATEIDESTWGKIKVLFK